MVVDDVNRNQSRGEVPRNLIRSAVLAGPCAAYASQFGDLPEQLLASGLSEQMIEDPESILETHQYLDLMARIGRSADDRLLFRAGFGTPMEQLGLAGKAVQSAPTLGDAIELTHQILGYVQSNSLIEINSHRGRCQLYYSTGFGESDEIEPDLQYSIGILSNLICLGQHKYDPELTIYCPGAKNTSMRDLPSNARFRDSRIAIVEFDRRLLHSSMPRSNAGQAEILRQFLSANPIMSATNFNMTRVVAELVECSMGVAKPSQQSICAMLGISARSLQRALNGEGTSFRQIVDCSRKSIALRELSGGRSVTDTSFFLGYDHPQNLTSACYRWFGKPPSLL